MAQGKMKIKSKPPPNTKKNQKKGPANTKRLNAPMKPKKQKLQEANKLRQAVTKTVNKAVEEEIRATAGKSKLNNLSNAQKAVAKYNKKENK
ncbi:unnamed protein product [Ceutorhynchus assimilis]|uniref:Uncharacterized protein n=1 Tax=Ceutorhynchus assimilis TaxID=467358 RepID=A0A9N9MVG5_9CUCU|nr:unnamed protein product [Ceutorhynchus assimilis]